MKHPRREEWVPFVFGEAEPEQREQLEAHLKECEQCSGEIAKWQGSLRKLDAWQLPPRQTRPRMASRPIAWAAAAVLMLGVGIAAGQWGAYSAKANLRSDLSRLETQIAELKNQTAGIPQARATSADAVTAETLKKLQLAVASMDLEREEDRQSFIALIQELDKKHDEALVSVRKDLETLASNADDQLQAARNRLLELSAVKVPEHSLIENQ
jgi:anti-sigma factor RsiW